MGLKVNGAQGEKPLVGDGNKITSCCNRENGELPRRPPKSCPKGRGPPDAAVPSSRLWPAWTAFRMKTEPLKYPLLTEGALFLPPVSKGGGGMRGTASQYLQQKKAAVKRAVKMDSIGKDPQRALLGAALSSERAREGIL